ncbi:EFR1 family ferrodoxin [Clostridium sp. LP20]|uniref:EFR1 family ferrodoxin n=1 Tax=Clostridium sp. LP20 TaxID=3418665 RepID=UPI003EE7E5A0
MELIKNTIVYFSGTGNSFEVAKDINHEIPNFNLIKITSLAEENKITFRGSVLGIVFPVYYGRLPLIVEKILSKVEAREDTYVFAVATNGGAPSDVLIKLSNLLKMNRINLNAGFLVKMPRNNIFSYSAINLEKQRKIIKNEKNLIKGISNKIINKEDCGCEVDNIIFVLFDKATTKLTDKIRSEINYNDKYFWTTDNCNGCGLCEEICPAKNIEIMDKKPLWKNKCEKCTACIQYCPNKAIEWGKSTLKRVRYTNPNISISELLNNQ